MIVALLASFLAAVLARFVAPRVKHAGWLLAVVPAFLFGYFLTIGSGLDGTDRLTETWTWIPALGISFTLTLDGFSRLFALIITGIGVLVTIYAGAYLAHAPATRRATFLTLILLFMSAMLGAVLADDLVVMFLFWEATSVLSFLLIGFDAQPSSRKAALQSLIVTAGGGLALLAGILLIGIELGTFSLSGVVARADVLADSPMAIPIMVLVLVGAFTKSAQVPFHFWLPAAMAAPTPASAYLHSATMVKLGIYLLARFDQAFADVPAFGTTLVVAGTTTMLVACTRALGSDGYKALLAQSTVGSLGLLVLLIGLDGPYAVSATVTFILAHALYKAALFFCAGIAIHATHEDRLSRLGGLRYALPLTTVAACLAAISMAGLPPTLGFIAKELFFDAQLHASTSWLVLAASVLVGAVFVAIAGVSAFKPFVLRTSDPITIHHGETPGLVAGPLLLGGLGLLFGIAPSLGSRTLIDPASSALAGTSFSTTLSLWHGLTPVLGLSALAIVLGVGLFACWNRIQPRVAAASWLDRVLGDGGYFALFNGTLRLATLSTRLLQNGDQHRYTSIVVAFVIVCAGIALVASGAPIDVALDSGTFHLPSAVVLGLMTAGALVATRTSSLLKATMSVGVIGFGSAVIYLFNGAPDLALTQFSVEVLVVVIVVALLLRVPDRTTSTRTHGETRRDLALAFGVGAIVFVALTTVVARPLDLTLTEYFAATSYSEAHGRNVVNVILVDYRALDTLGELSVVSFASIAVWGLLRRRRSGWRS